MFLLLFYRVLIIDDVITAGTAITEAMDILNHAKAQACGVCISLDRQEKVTVADTKSAIQHVQEKFGLPVISIANLDSLVTFLENEDDGSTTQLSIIKSYRSEYGVQG